MPKHPRLSGVFAAAVTPLTAQGDPDLDALPALLEFLADRGCHGVLVLGTTGEGPSFSVAERIEVIQAAVRIRETRPSLKLLAGTGCASLSDTVAVTRAAFDAGVDGTVTLPSFYYKGQKPAQVSEYFRRVIRQAVPSDGCFLFYHIPNVSGVPVPAETIDQLRKEFPRQVTGLKDSSASLDEARAFGERFGDLSVFSGTDSLFSKALAAGASGCITAMANVASPCLREVWDARLDGRPALEAQARLNAAREVQDHYPAAPALKAMLARRYGFPLWPVRPPLLPLDEAAAERFTAEMSAALGE